MDDAGASLSDRQSMPNDDLKELEEEVKGLRQRQTVLLQETENLRRERLLEELQEMKRCVAMLEKNRDELNDYLRPLRSNVHQQLGRSVYIIPPVMLLLICCNVQVMRSDWLFVCITVYTYAVSCYTECKMNDEVRAPVSVAIYISASIVAILTTGTSSIWKEMANVYTQLSFVVVTCLAITRVYHSVKERGFRSLVIPEYVPVVGYGAVVGTACEWYWDHQQIGLAIRNVSILMVYYTSHYFIMGMVYRASRRSHEEHTVRRQSFLWELLRASAVYAIFFETQQFSKAEKTPELTHDQSIAEIFFCLEFIRLMFTTFPMLIDDFCFYNRSGVPRTYMLVYGCASIAILRSSSKVSFPVVRVLFIFITWLLFYQVEKRIVKEENVSFYYNSRKMVVMAVLITAFGGFGIRSTSVLYCLYCLNTVLLYETFRTFVNICIMIILFTIKLGSDILNETFAKK